VIEYFVDCTDIAFGHHRHTDVPLRHRGASYRSAQ
jgi:hypothetical protein